MPKQGRTIQELAAELDRQSNAKEDYVVQANRLTVGSTNYTLQDGERVEQLRSTMLLPELGKQFPLTEWAHGQVAGHLGIPKEYYQKIRKDHPDLLDRNVNTLFRARPEDEKRLVRTLDGNARAMMSPRYRMLDNVDLMRFILPEFKEIGDIQFASADVTERKLRIKVTTPRIKATVVGETVQAGVSVWNSEVRDGNIGAAPFVVTLSCLNGATYESYGNKRRHVGRDISVGNEDNFQYFADDTRQAEDRAFFLKIRDLVRSCLGEEVFQRLVNNMREAAGATLPRDIPKVIEVVTKKYSLTNDEGDQLFQELINGPRRTDNFSLFDLSQALTSLSQKIDSYDRASEMEVLGGQIIDLPKSDWREISLAV